MMTHSLYALAATAIATRDPEQKCRKAVELRRAWDAGRLDRSAAAGPEPIGEPGRPASPALVPPRQLLQRKLNSDAGRATLVHAVAHIEFNAINLALDAVYRFRQMPEAYYTDWLRVAAEEAGHFRMLRTRLRELGHDYGDFPAHDGLWEMCRETAHDVMVRMALVPRVLEARGLDVTPGMMERLRRAGDDRTVACLSVILREEEAHVAIGSHWYRHCCAERGLAPEPLFRELLQQYMRGGLKGPFNVDARLKAGFSEQELKELERLAG